MKIINCEQGSEEWFAARMGRPSASKFSEIITASGQQSKSREKYLYQLAGERLSGIRDEGYKSKSMQAGNEREAAARDVLSMIKDVDIMQVGLVVSDDEVYGASPDGVICDRPARDGSAKVIGGCEIKSPEVHTHIGYLLDGKLPSTYFHQVQGNMLVTETEWWYFMSYYPNIKPMIIQVARDHKFTEKLREELYLFDKDLTALVKRLS